MNEDVLAFTKDEINNGINSLRVDGGASANDLLMQMQSDFSNISVIRPTSCEATALGAAFLAGLGVGFYKNREELSSLSFTGSAVFKPNINETEREDGISKWHKAVRACRTFSEE